MSKIPEKHHQDALSEKSTRSRILFSFKVAIRGLWWSTKERNMRIHLLATLVVIGMSWWLEINYYECALVLLAIGLVISAELANTALEELADLSRDAHAWPYGATTRLRDISAAGVLVSAIIAACIGAIVFVPKLATLFV